MTSVGKTEWSNDDTNECDDGDQCMEGDYCDSGGCVAGTQPVECNDHNPCTEDTCNPPIGCIFVGSSGDCDDGDACTENDFCTEGKCVGEEVVCDDANECTKDSCDVEVGCTNEPTTDPCDDGDACTQNDICTEGECVGEEVVCDDADLCNGIETCDPADGCAPGNPLLCDNGDVCDGLETCDAVEGCLAGTSLDCDDGNPCTGDSCDAAIGCINEPNSEPCTDDDACTLVDTCVDSICVGEALDCNDGNPCTDDLCDPVDGCYYETVPGDCDDGTVCTVGDFCQGGECQPGNTLVDCDDDNVCTTDSCDPIEGCQHMANTIACDDQDACTVGDFCADSECKPGYDTLACDDGNVCTTDTCNPQMGCENEPNAEPCDDMDACTVGDYCDGTSCLAGEEALNCDDNDQCTGTETCDPAAGCVAGTPPVCNDGDLCNGVETCDAVQGCVDGLSPNCNDNDACTNDSCDPLDGCEHTFNAAPCDDSNECTENDACNQGQCEGEIKVCNDDNFCTTDTCNPANPGGCVFTPNDKQCDDEDPCTLGDVCVDGECLSGAGVLYCNDDNECTKDECQAGVGCKYKNMPYQCDDGNPCTLGDYCANGQCLSGGNDCDCQNDADCAPQEDGNLCNGTLFCDKAVMPYKCKVKPGTVVFCDPDLNTECSVQQCAPETGICGAVAVNEGGPCNDEDGCTADDECTGGQCIGIPCQDLGLFCVDSECVEQLVCGGVACPELDGYKASCNQKEFCEYADTDSSGWKKWDVWLWIPPGTFEMGSPADEAGHHSREEPVHPVTIGYGYFISKYEIVVAQYEACKADQPAKCTSPSTADWDAQGWGTNSSANGRSDHPQNGLTWQQARDFCAWIAPGGRLPSEAEWEYAATGLVHTKYPWGDSPEPTCSNDTAVFNEAGGTGGWGCGQGGTGPVGEKTAGASWSGAWDMSGNVWEWCEDWYHDSYTDAPDDGSAWVIPAGSDRAVRGGAFLYGWEKLRSAMRAYTAPSNRSARFGARCVRPDPNCQPDCEGKTCGPDGCGGTCGDCDDGEECQDGECIEEELCRSIYLPGVQTTPGVSLSLNPSHFTVDAWVKLESGSKSSTYIVRRGSTWQATGSWQLAYTYESSSIPNNTIGFLVKGQGSSKTYVNGGSLSYGSWHHVAAQYTNGTVYLFVDGALVATGDPPVPLTNETGFWLAANSAPNKTYLDEIRLSNGALFQDGYDPVAHAQPDQNTVLLYHFDEPNGNIAHDSSGNENDVSMPGAVWVEEGPGDSCASE